MKYKCSHCQHAFDLAERDFKRCPSCFWTTSLVLLEDESPKPEFAKEIKPPASSIPTAKRPDVNLKSFAIPILALIALCGLIALIVTQKDKISKLSFKLPVSLPVFNLGSQKTAGPKAPAPLNHFLKLEEQTVLLKPFELTIPRKLSSDEEEILKKEVSLPKTLSEKPKLAAWTKDDFEKSIESEQKKRKVYFGWSYQRSVMKTFENNYPKAVEAYEKGDMFLARDYFLKSLGFPIFRNDVRRHRAVALVMLRPFINDVIGKVAILNQELLRVQFLTQAEAIIKSYESLFSVLDLQQWDKALSQISDLKRQTQDFENKQPEAGLNYGKSFALLDPELQNAINMEATPKTESVVNFKTMEVDLDLKEKVVRQNTQDELFKTKKEAEDIFGLLQTGDLIEARKRMQAVEFPPELVDQITEKVALIDQAEALQKEKEGKKS